MSTQFLQSVAPAQVSAALLRTECTGPQILAIENSSAASTSYAQLGKESTSAAALLSFFTGRGLSLSQVASSVDTVQTAVATGYNRDGSTQSFSGQTLTNYPVSPGSFSTFATAGSPSVLDVNMDGKLWVNGAATLVASGGSFATMAGETLAVAFDGGPTWTVQFGTEATIAAAIATINATVAGGTAVELDSNDVNLVSATTGPTSKVQVFSIGTSAGVTTKLGIPAGTATTSAGSLVYSTGVLTLSYPTAYTPSAGAATSGTVTGSVTGPFQMATSDTVVVTIDTAHGPYTGTITAVAAIALGSGGSFATMASETMVVQVDNHEPQTITFGTESTITLAIATLNNQLLWSSAEDVDANDVKILTDHLGSGAQLILSSVAAGITTKLGLSAGTYTGVTGSNVADIQAVQASEIVTIMAAVTGFSTYATASATSAGALKVTSKSTGTSSKVQFSAGTGTTSTILGVGTSAHAGAASSAVPLTCSYIQTPSIPAASRTAVVINNVSNQDQLVVYGQGVNGPALLKMQVDPFTVGNTP